MTLKGLDLFHLSKLTTHQVDHVTCLECCKYYIAPETATCGHSLCHSCWRGRRTCPSCAAPLERRSLKLNLQLQNLTEHIHALGDSFEKLFNVKLDEFVLDETSNEVQEETDPTKNVKDWLASSQNQFSAPVLNSEPFSQEISNPIELSTSKIQVHMNSKKSKSPEKVVYIPPPQDDWDKIEQLPDTDELSSNNKENVTKASNKLSLFIGEEYTTDHPRRSSRKRDYSNHNEMTSKSHDTDKQSSKNSSSEAEKKYSKAKQNWNNVKRMRKEFSKLNQKNKSKLNVSIEMCKKTQTTTNKPVTEVGQLNIDKESEPAAYTIEDNTPDINENNSNVKQINSIKSIPDNLVALSTEKDDDIFNLPDISTKLDNSHSHKNNNIGSDQKQNNSVQEKSSMQKPMNENITKISNGSTNVKVPFIKKVVLGPNCTENNQDSDLNNKSTNSNSEDIEITIKVGNTVANITIKRKNNDVQFKVNTDQQVQTTSDSDCPITINNETHMAQKTNQKRVNINIENDNYVPDTQIIKKNNGPNNVSANFSKVLSSTKKNTASADTATVQFEITESVEKELSSVMECVQTEDTNESKLNKIHLKTDHSKNNLNNLKDDKDCEELINDLDIFENESLQEHVQLLNKSKQTPSEILMPTVKNKTQKHPDKRERDINDDQEVPNAKKIKTISLNSEITTKSLKNDSVVKPSSKDESMNYDDVMGQVFANIDADIEQSQKNTKQKQAKDDSRVITKSQFPDNILKSSISTQKIAKEIINEKYSENVFSVIERDDETNDLTKKNNDGNGSTQRHIDNLLTPGMCQDLISTNEDNMELIKEQCTPFNENEDSDKSVVEETPQKDVSFPKPKTDASINANKLKRVNSGASKVPSSSQLVKSKSIISVSDTLGDSTKTSKDQTIIEAVTNKHTLETPLTINKFVDHIKHKSTPVARKSLNFDSEINAEDIDPEQTLCPSSVVAKTTQEKEFMAKAFEQSPKSPVKKPLMPRNAIEVDMKYCIAGSCLSAVELTNVKYLCRKYNWKYVDKYTRELTHLVVGVDEENRSQRSVKYMCALAASKWIVSYEWVDACISTNLVVGESLYEALDGTGEPGPKRSRLAKTKLFQGITFYCMPPFTVLDVGALKEMLEAAGGRVVNEIKAVRVVADAPALLLAEPEHTQEDRFMYLALELNIVPVNYEWVLNCLGSYSLSSIHELLMCPTALLPPATNKWPEVLMSRDSF